MKICSVTIWYNPDEVCANNIHTYNTFVEKCYIIDNSISDNSALISDIPNAIYISNKENLGIAKALNIGCSKAVEDGFEWCLTMDQDSSWDKVNLQKYIEYVINNISNKNVSFAPNYINETTKTEILNINRCISSGNIIKLDIWQKIGMFYEPFFIDEVDYEFCYRLKENNYDIIQFQDVHMNHNLGDNKKHFFPMLCHSGVRLYYMYRNSLYEKEMHPSFYRINNYASWLRYFSMRIIIEGVARLKFQNIYFLIKAKKDFTQKKKGKIK